MGSIWTWPPPLSGAGAASQIYLGAPGQVSLSVPPALLGRTPGARDAEFDSDPGWQYYEFLPGGVVRPFVGVPNWDARIAGVSPAISFTQRKSFVTLQPGNNSAATFEAFYTPATPITWVANTAKWFWCGGGTGYEYVQDYRRGLTIASNLAGVPDRQNQAVIGNIDIGAGMAPVSSYSYVASVLSGPTGGSQQGAPQTSSAHWPYLALYMKSAATRAGITIESWVFNDQGQRQRIATGAFSPLTATYFVGFYIRSATTGAGGGIAPATGFQPGIFQADFFRELDGPTPPWARG